ncbi:hypothetical protein N7463_003724 [Penicillium fimorum]|uniref:Carrier domain-containing protein n=1 Tax=Penicillium fimorum TaxID=1882269 RepID=A0A9X0C9Q0_9EURO|nr:hypothetical protein N7463_003724 [Penicillium fimorum]
MVEIKTAEPVQQVVVNVETESGVIGNCISPIARETGLEVSEITDETTFEQTGVDSLMSLVVAEKFRNYSSVSRAFCSLTVQQLEA